MSSSEVSGDIVDKIIGGEGLFKDSSVYTDAFTSYSGLSAAGYRHRTVSYSSGRVCLRVRLM